MKLPQTCTVAALAAVLSACAVTEGVQSVAQDPFGEGVESAETPAADAGSGWNAWGGSEEAPMYARDGSPVGTGGAWEGAPAGSTWGAPDRGLSEEPSSRFMLLDRYQQVLEDQEHLQLELDGAHAELDEAWARIALLEQQFATLSADHAAQQQELDQARARVTEMADRLVTAEIHRLEAEKRWYEAEIAAHGVTPATAGASSTSTKEWGQ